MSFVLPGDAEVLARSLLQSIFITDDLPTLLLPIKAYSGLSGFGHCSTDGLDIRYTACLMIMGKVKKGARSKFQATRIPF